MENENFNIFGAGNGGETKDIILPSVSKAEIESQMALGSTDISKAINGETVQKLIVPESTEIEKENYVFDFSAAGSVSIYKKEALKSLRTNDGDVALYLYKGNALTLFGHGDRYRLARLIPIVKKSIFGDIVKIYKNFEKDKALEEVVSRDITTLRLNL